MRLLLSWYYWYRNRWDELLLIGVLQWIARTFEKYHIDIVAQDPKRLQTRLNRHHQLLPHGVSVWVVQHYSRKNYTGYDHVVLGGGEVLSDARPFPYNGWTTLLKFRSYLNAWKLSLVWGIGSIKYRWSVRLHRQMINKAIHVVVRDVVSHQHALQYNPHAILARDFAYDVLDQLSLAIKPSTYSIVNCNDHLRTPEIKEQVIQRIQAQTSWPVYYFPAAMGSDDHDLKPYHELKAIIPTLELYDRTKHTIIEVASFFANAKVGLVTRLHAALLLDQYHVSYTPLVYQEKLNHVLGK